MSNKKDNTVNKKNIIDFIKAKMPSNISRADIAGVITILMEEMYNYIDSGKTLKIGKLMNIDFKITGPGKYFLNPKNINQYISRRLRIELPPKIRKILKDNIDFSKFYEE